MILLADIGNTRIKTACVERGQLQHQFSIAVNRSADLPDLLKACPPAVRCWIAAVRDVPKAFYQALPTSCVMAHLTAQTPLPFRISYDSPETLGSDRIAAVAAAYGRFPKTNVLVIDMGSCITYDLLTAEGVYKGGGISPGIHMRFKAMHHFTGKLPLAEPVRSVQLTGNNTQKSIQSGVMNGVQAEIDGIISQYEDVYEKLTVILGGGDNIYFDKQFKNNIFAVSNLVIEGLQVVSEFNDNQ